jgi:hypothetical protein
MVIYPKRERARVALVNWLRERTNHAPADPQTLTSTIRAFAESLALDHAADLGACTVTWRAALGAYKIVANLPTRNAKFTCWLDGDTVRRLGLVESAHLVVLSYADG